MPDWTTRQAEGGVPADASFVMVNAEGDLTGEQLLSALALMKANNLSDLPAAATARSNLGLGTAAVEDVGTGAGNIVQLDGTGKLPAVNGSLLTNLSAGGASFPLGLALTGVSYPRVSGHNLTTGDIDLGTVPVGKKWLVVGFIAANTAVDTIVFYVQVKIGGTYYRLNSNYSLATANSTTFITVSYVANAGEILALNATVAGLNIVFQVVEVDATSAIHSSILTSLSVGDNLIYTVPAGKTGFILSENLLAFGVPRTHYMNSSGGSRTIGYISIVPFGETLGTQHKIYLGDVVGSPQKQQFTCGGTLNAGDMIYLNVDAATATQTTWVNVVEL